MRLPRESAFVSSDLLAIKVRYPTSGEPDEEVVCAYYGRYTRNVNGADTAFLQFGHRNSADDGNFNLYTEEAESRIECEFFTVDSNGAATTTPFLTHGVGVKHWVQWPSTDPNGQAIQALALARGNQSRLDALGCAGRWDSRPDPQRPLRRHHGSASAHGWQCRGFRGLRNLQRHPGRRSNGDRLDASRAPESPRRACPARFQHRGRPDVRQRQPIRHFRVQRRNPVRAGKGRCKTTARRTS